MGQPVSDLPTLVVEVWVKRFCGGYTDPRPLRVGDRCILATTCERCYGQGTILVVNVGEEPCPKRCTNGTRPFATATVAKIRQYDAVGWLPAHDRWLVTVTDVQPIQPNTNQQGETP